MGFNSLNVSLSLLQSGNITQSENNGAAVSAVCYRSFTALQPMGCAAGWATIPVVTAAISSPKQYC